MLFRVAICGLAIALPVAVRAAEPVDYVKDVKSIFAARCFACHAALKQESGLRLDTAASIRVGGDSGPAVEPGNTAASLMIARVSAADESERMPPEGKPLTPEQIAAISAWIDAGAKGPSDEQPERDPRDHWAFNPPVRPAVPNVERADWVANPIDAFLSAEHEARGLSPQPPADRAILLRRVSLDLIGLPPTREDLSAFLADGSSDAYERAVDRLLESPQYGERWARHWMDVWRYSDWYGRRAVPDVMNSYPQIWRWRDWIVESLNEDKGYDRMVEQMLAADELWPADDADLPATGFLARNWFKWNYGSWMKDNVEHTGKAFLGITLNCCHCHDHKYDPFTFEEYFKFRAIFEPLELRHDRVAGLPDPGPFKKYVYAESYGPIAAGAIRVFDEKLDAQTFAFTGGDARNTIPDKPPLQPGVPAALGGEPFSVKPVELPATAWYPGLKPFVQAEETASRQAAVTAATEGVSQSKAALAQTATQLAATATTAASDAAGSAAIAVAKTTVDDAATALRIAEAQLATANAQAASIAARIAADMARYVDQAANADDLAKAAGRAERQANLDAARESLARGEQAVVLTKRKAAADPNAAADVPTAEQQLAAATQAVAAAETSLAAESTDYTPLSPIYPRTSTGRRAALANWIASEHNPLTARVAANHIWSWHFGRPLVATTFNFGRSGAKPTHPALLDWLAVELMESGWKMKPIHRLIVTSNAYRMQSATGGLENPNLAIDRDNTWLWRFNPARMEAEVVRDSVLFVAGSLDPAIGGQEIDHVQGLTSNRRSLYFAHHGEAKMEFLELFDGANPIDCYQRTTSVLPQQALAMTNSELAQAQGRLLAGRLWDTIEASSDKADPATGSLAFVEAAFEQILSRRPTDQERALSAELLRTQEELFQVTDPAQLATAAAAGAAGPSSDPARRARESLIHALLSHNDFVTIR